MIAWPLRWPLAAAIVGSALLVFWFPRLGPGVGLPILPLTVLMNKARAAAQALGVGTAGAQTSVESAYSTSLERYRQQHSLDANARDASPLGVRVTIQRAIFGLDSAGRLLLWQIPEGFKAAANTESAAFHLLAGADAATYKGPLHSAGDERGEEVAEWKKPLPQHSEVRERIRITTQDGTVRSAERKVYLASDDDDDMQGYWGALAGLFGTISVLAVLAMLLFCLVWMVRKSVSYQFPLRLGGALVLLGGLSEIAGSRAQNALSVYRRPEGTDWFTLIVTALLVIGFIIAGRGILPRAHGKWSSLEQLCRLAPLARSAGVSLASGVLFSPLLLAIPYLVAGCGLIPNSWVLPNNLGLVYSRTPLLDSLDFHTQAYLLGFFGFAVPAIQRVVRIRWLGVTALAALGTLYFANQTRVITGPAAAPLVAGFLMFVLSWIVYSRFDLLTVMVLQASTVIIYNMLILLRSGSAPWTLAIALIGLLLAGHWIWLRGEETSKGDPQATFPPLTGFRAEREKLRAEFSVARRAQQDMLPQTPPAIPGYSLSASCTPSLEVGGDLYDFLKLRDGRIGISVADVSGKGVPAALYMTLTKGLLAAVSKNKTEPANILEEVNRHLHAVTRKKVFVTMALGFLDPKTRIMQCVRAGHNPVVWRQTSRSLTTLVSPPGLGLGITAGRVFAAQLKVHEMSLVEGDAVVFYSDGITEAMNSDLEQFGEQRLMEAVSKTDTLDAEASRDSILAEVSDFLAGVHPQDDMTLVVLRVGTNQDERMTVRG